jgi:formamidopyrimidine-DNA glycosylase
MPELPDIEVYIEALEERIGRESLQRVRLSSPFLIRTVEPPLESVHGLSVRGLSRIGKRVVVEMDQEIYLVFHLMIAGRFQWKEAGAKIPGRLGLAAFDFDPGTLLLTEAGSKKRASLHIVRGEDGLSDLDPGGLEVLECDLKAFRAALGSARHTLKRALTDPTLFSGIGNAYSDEILHRAALSPFKRTDQLDTSEARRLFKSVQDVLQEWVARLREERGDGFPKKVTAFHKEMAVHGKYEEPCPTCGSPVQRIRYAQNECNYCATCQTEGRLLADRALSRLLKEDWPRTLEELENRKRPAHQQRGS